MAACPLKENLSQSKNKLLKKNFFSPLSPEELAEKKREMFDAIKKLTQGRYDAYDTVLHNCFLLITQHSIDDGLELMRELNMPHESIFKRHISPEVFISRHSDFSRIMLAKMQENKKYMSTSSQSSLEQFENQVDEFADAPSDDNYDNIIKGYLLDANDESREAVEKIEGYYANLLHQRNFAEDGNASANLTELALRKNKEKARQLSGSQVAESALRSLLHGLEAHAYTGGLKDVYRKAFEMEGVSDEQFEKIIKKLPPETRFALESGSVISQNEMQAIFDAKQEVIGDYGITDEQYAYLRNELNKRTYRPLDVVHNLKQKEAKRMLRKDILKSLVNAGFNPDEYEIVFDEGRGKHEIRKREVGDVDKETNDSRAEQMTSEKIDVKKFEKQEVAITGEVKEVIMFKGEPFIYSYERNQSAPHHFYYDGQEVVLDTYLKDVKLGIHDTKPFILYEGASSILWFEIFEHNSIAEPETENVYNGVRVGDGYYFIEQSAGTFIVMGEEGNINLGKDLGSLRLTNIGERPLVCFLKKETTTQSWQTYIYYEGKNFGPYKSVDGIKEIDGKLAFQYESYAGTHGVYFNGNTYSGVAGTLEGPFELTNAVDSKNIPIGTNEDANGEFLENADGEKVSNSYRRIYHVRNVGDRLAFYAVDKNDRRFIQYGQQSLGFLRGQEVIDIYTIGGECFFQSKWADNHYELESFHGKVQHDGNKEYIFSEPFEVIKKDGFVYVMGIDKATGKYVVYSHKDIWKKEEAAGAEKPKEEFKTSIDQQYDLQLLDMLERPDPEKIKMHLEYLETRREEMPQSQVSANPKIADTLNAAIKRDPKAFLSQIPATQDNTSEWYVQNVLYTLFPEIPLNKEREALRNQGSMSGLFNLFKGQNRGNDIKAETYLSRQELTEFRDGDPKMEKAEEVIQLREERHEMIVTGLYGSYDESTKRWEACSFMPAAETDEPLREYTATLPNIKGLKEVALPKMLGSEIVRERVKGITHYGREIPLETSVDAQGRVVARIPANERLARVVYSEQRSELSTVPEDISWDQYNKFKKGFVKAQGESMNEQIVILPAEIVHFLDSIKVLEPKRQLAVIEEYVRDHSYYDFDNAEMQKEKAGKGLDEKLYLMQERMKKLKTRNPKLAVHHNIQFAGVCADFALLTAAMLRRQGILSGIMDGFRPNGLSVTTKQAHGTAFAVLPNSEGEPQVISVDGTPGGFSPEEKKMLAGIQQPSLAEKEKLFEKEKDELIHEAEEKLREAEGLLEQYDAEKIKTLSNGELERVVNTLLRYKVRESHVGMLERIFNVARYGGFNAGDILSDDLGKKIEFRSFVESEAKAERTRERGRGEKGEEKHAGMKLTMLIGDFSRNYAKDMRQSAADPFEIMERIVAAAGRNLEDIETRSAYALIAYLRAKKMVKPQLSHR